MVAGGAWGDEFCWGAEDAGGGADVEGCAVGMEGEGAVVLVWLLVWARSGAATTRESRKREAMRPAEVGRLGTVTFGILLN